MPQSSHPTRPYDPGLLADLLRHPLIARVAPHVSPRVWAVGGVVRDALGGHAPGPDVDLVVEGDACAEAEAVARALGVDATLHRRFGTAVLRLADGHVDLVTARRETYPHPGALPVVTPGTLADDLARRDFTVNAVAVRLTGDERGAVADPHGGRGDLARGVLRAVRPGEFAEDPSRIVRAARYASRLGLVPDVGTEGELRAAAPGLDWTSARVGDELRRLLEEGSAARGVGALAAWGAPGLVVPPQPPLEALDAAAREMGVVNPPVWALRLGAVATPAMLDVVALPGWAVEAARGVQQAPAVTVQVTSAPRASDVDAVMCRVPVGALVALRAGADPRVETWWRDHRGVEVAVTGADLVRLGVPPGPALGEALRRVRAAVVDGDVTTPDEQTALALDVSAGRA